MGVSYGSMNELLIARNEKEYWENQRAKNNYLEKQAQDTNTKYSNKSVKETHD